MSSSHSNDVNPYAPPKTDISVEHRIALASRGTRLAAAILDTILMFALFAPVMFATGYMQRSMAGESGLGEDFMYGLASIAVLLILHGYTLANYGQTLGKRLLKIRIVSVENDQILPFGRLIGLRYLPLYVLTAIPGLGTFIALIDVLFIFREDRRCVHDLVAGTKVVTTGEA